MKFGVREICDVVFKAKSAGNLGKYKYKVGQPVLYIDSAKASTIESASTTVYATGGRGNARLIAWEGEKTLTFTVEDALLSPIGFAILSGADLLNPEANAKIAVHRVAKATLGTDGIIILTDKMDPTDDIYTDYPVFVMEADVDGSLTGRMFQNFKVTEIKVDEVDGQEVKKLQSLVANSGEVKDLDENVIAASDRNSDVLVDFYVKKPAATVNELTIEAGNFAGNWYVEASTLFRRQSDGQDLPAEIVFPNVKIQSNFTFNMAATGDPSTFTFTMDAMPGKVNGKEALCVIQIIDETTTSVDATSGDSIIDNDN